MVVSPRMVRAAEDLDNLVFTLDVIDKEQVMEFIETFEKEHGFCEDENCQHVEKFQFAAFLIDEWRKRFK